MIVGMTRRQFTSLAALGAASAQTWEAAIDIADRRELFVDRHLVERLIGGTALRLHAPQPRETVLVHDAPWEGPGSGYHSIFEDAGRYRMFYKAYHMDVSTGKLRADAHGGHCCYAESEDGIHWRKPELGLVEFRGSKANNIVLASGPQGGLNLDAAHPAVFLDTNPAAGREARYKAFIRSADRKAHGLIALRSADGFRWTPMRGAPVVTDGAFDSQNLGFWDGARGQYRAYWRSFTEGVTTGETWKPGGLRAIRTALSDDFVTWREARDLHYVDSPAEQLYTNQVKPYARAPHLLIGFPTRYTERPWSPSLRALPEEEHRRQRSTASMRYGTAITEALLMASRDGVLFHRWNEAFLRPGIERPGTWNYGHQYVGWHLVETRSALAGAPNELSLYASESYWTGNSSEVRRYTLRLDGFVSASAGLGGGELLTRPLRFSGGRLRLNFATSAVGLVQVELQKPDGGPLPGFAAADCDEVFGDTVDRAVSWRGSEDVSTLVGKPVRVRFVLRDADLYAFRFAKL
jgi:hypothetical protein